MANDRNGEFHEWLKVPGYREEIKRRVSEVQKRIRLRDQRREDALAKREGDGVKLSRPRKYENNAARQKAYRERQSVDNIGREVDGCG